MCCVMCAVCSLVHFVWCLFSMGSWHLVVCQVVGKACTYAPCPQAGHYLYVRGWGTCKLLFVFFFFVVWCLCSCMFDLTTQKNCCCRCGCCWAWGCWGEACSKRPARGELALASFAEAIFSKRIVVVVVVVVGLGGQALRCGGCWISSWTTSPKIAFQIHNGAALLGL